jgi:UDP-glucose 4-epimerase
MQFFYTMLQNVQLKEVEAMSFVITVFGGSGFVGSHVCDKLSDAGHDVRIFDLVESPYLRPDQSMIQGDILNELHVQKAISGSEFVFNFAGIADIDEARERPLETIRHNILGNSIVLEGCRKEKVSRIIFASSVYVYSQSGAFYRASKQACENYIEVYQEVYGLDYTVLRFGTLYGSRADERNAIYRYIKQGIQEGQIDYDGDSEAQREYIHVEDAARACVDILNPEFMNQHIVLTGTQAFKVRELLGMIAEIFPGDVRVNYAYTGKKTAHYILTPHKYSPKIGKKLIPPLQVDLGQGLHQQIEELYCKYHPELSDVEGIWIKK